MRSRNTSLLQNSDEIVENDVLDALLEGQPMIMISVTVVAGTA